MLPHKGIQKRLKNLCVYFLNAFPFEVCIIYVGKIKATHITIIRILMINCLITFQFLMTPLFLINTNVHDDDIYAKIPFSDLECFCLVKRNLSVLLKLSHLFILTFTI